MTEPLGRVAVFWHYDNLPPPDVGSSPREISRATYNTISNIRQVLYKFGIINCFRAYVGSMPLQAKWELQAHGVTVIECVWNASETMITADMFRFALDYPSLGTTLVLISSSFTLAYTVSVLGARRYRVALISMPDPQNSVLLAQAHEVMDWRFLLSQGNIDCSQPPPPPTMQNSSTTSTLGHTTGVGHGAYAGPTVFLHNAAEVLEHSFTVNDLNPAGNSGGPPASPTSHPTSVQLELQGPPPVDDHPPSRQVEEAILTRPAVEEAETIPGPPCFDSRGRRIDILTRPFNRSVSERAHGESANGMRPRANSLQDDRRPRLLSGNPTFEDPFTTESLPTPRIVLPSLGELMLRKPLSIEAPAFIPTPSLRALPPKPSDSATTKVSFPGTLDPDPTLETIEETRSPFVRLEERYSVRMRPPTCPTASTVKPETLVDTTKSGPNYGFTRGERRAVETVINVLLELKSKGEERGRPDTLPALILAKDRAVYRRVGNRANRFWKLIELGVQMDWLEIGPEKAWIDVGRGWAEEIDPRF